MILISQHNCPGSSWEWWCLPWSSTDALLRAGFTGFTGFTGTLPSSHRCFRESFVADYNSFSGSCPVCCVFYCTIWLEGASCKKKSEKNLKHWNKSPHWELKLRQTQGIVRQLWQANDCVVGLTLPCVFIAHKHHAFHEHLSAIHCNMPQMASQ